MTTSRPKNTTLLNKLSACLSGEHGGRAPSDSNNPISPDQDTVVVGDIHGRFDLLENLLRKIEAKVPNAKLVFVGDYVDRGPSSRDVLGYLSGLGELAICLMGNHERMLLDFLDDPMENGRRWLRNGGAQTLTSYGISLDETASVSEVQGARDRFDEQLSGGTETWLRARPLIWKTGNVLVTHAGPDPKLSIAMQEEESFLWGHNRFLRDERSDGLWVAHGHWIQDRALCRDGRISVDTGAFHTNHLSAAIISTDGTVKFLST
jgi:serine/threonine protein phosphatase 1